MVIKVYSVSLDNEIVEKARKLWDKKNFGKKLSPLINHLLEEWVKDKA